MGDQMRLHAAVGELHQVKPRYTRGKGEVGDADEVPGGDAVVMPLQSIERAPKQTGSYLTAGSCRSPKGGSSARRGGCQTG
jgi:hypothetical protein